MVQVSLVANFVLFQIGWFVAVVGAAYGYPTAGVAYALVFAVWHHWRLNNNRGRELLFVAAGGLLGYVMDSLLVLGGFIEFPPFAWLGYPSTVWMVSLWVMFAMTLRHSLGWLRGRFLLAAVLGAVSGPLAYWAGNKLGAVELVGQTRALLAVGAVWTISMVALLHVERLTRASVPEQTD